MLIFKLFMKEFKKIMKKKIQKWLNKREFDGSGM